MIEISANFKGFKPTYNTSLQFGNYIKRCESPKIVSKRGDLKDTIKYIEQAINDHYCEVKELATILQGKNIEQTVFNIWHFLRPLNLGGQVNYHLDTAGTEEIRTPARSWDDRIHGIDCEDLAIFGGSILKNLNIPFKLRIVGFFGSAGYQHIFVTVPNNKAEMVLDPVMRNKFNELPKNISKTMNINYMSGITGTDPVIAEIDKIATINGLGSTDSAVVETAKDIQKLAKVVELQNMVYFANVEKELNNQSEISGLGNIWDKLRQKAEELKRKLAQKKAEELEKAKKLWQEAKDKLKNAGNKAGDTLKKYGLAPVRGAFLLLVKINFLGIAKKLYVGYLSDSEAKRKGLNCKEYLKAKAGRIKAENLIVQWGGTKQALKNAVFNGRGKKRFEKGLDKYGHAISGLGDAGVTEAAAATAMGTSAPLWVKVWSWLKNINWKGLFNVLDKAKGLIPNNGDNNGGDNGDDNNADKNGDTSKDKTGSSTGDDDKGLPKWVLPVALASAGFFLLK